MLLTMFSPNLLIESVKRKQQNDMASIKMFLLQSQSMSIINSWVARICLTSCMLSLELLVMLNTGEHTFSVFYLTYAYQMP